MSDANSRSARPAADVSDLGAELVRAEQADAAGNHSEAINRLAAAARKNNVEALTRLGKRLLVGDRAPPLPNDGARLLHDAVVLGGAEAAAIIAVLNAAGVSKSGGLERALECLVLAAERGWQPAQAQLRVLADESSANEEAGDVWRRLASRVDPVGWQSQLPGTDLSISPRIRLMPDFVSRAICQWLIEKSRSRLSRALVYDALNKQTVANETRTNSAATLNLLETDLVCALVQVRMAACLGVSFRQLEPISVLHYDEGEEITEHFDFVDPNVPDYEDQIATRGQRIATFLIYLNDEYGSGDTDFPELGITHKGRVGDGLFFINSLPDGSADIRTLHAGRPPLSGEKWIVSQFVRNRPTF